MNDPLDVVALGELLIDFASLSTDSDGYPTMAAHPGGAPANFLAAITKWGGRTALLGKVGEDTFGNLLVETLERAGIETAGLVKDPQVFTTLAFVTFDADGDRHFAFARKPGADTQLSADEVDFTQIDRARALHFGTLSLTDEPVRTATQKAVAYAKERGKVITFDPNLREPLWADLQEAREQMLWGLSQADVVKISDNEVEFLFALDPQSGAQYIREQFGVGLVFVTCGGEGCYFANAVTEGHLPALAGVKVVDTTGAGDIFGGSAVWGVLESRVAPDQLTAVQLQNIVAFATAAAGLSTEKQGGISSIPEKEVVLSRCRGD